VGTKENSAETIRFWWGWWGWWGCCTPRGELAEENAKFGRGSKSTPPTPPTPPFSTSRTPPGSRAALSVWMGVEHERLGH
jgi:hypothetical protein